MQPREDAYDRAEREQEERQKAAEQLGRVMGVERPSAQAEEQERTGAVSADAGEHTPEEPPTEPTGVEQLRNFLLYDADGRPRR